MDKYEGGGSKSNTPNLTSTNSFHLHFLSFNNIKNKRIKRKKEKTTNKYQTCMKKYNTFNL